MGEFIIQIIKGLIIIIIGILNMKGNISLLHSYHRKRVKKEDIIPFGKKVGIGNIIIGITIILAGVFTILNYTHIIPFKAKAWLDLKEKKNKVTSHAELLAINKASKKLKNWRLNDCDIYITLQPCPMCSSAIKQSRIRNIYYILDNKHNEISNEILQKTDINKRIMKMEKINNDSYKKTIETFFKKQRNK